MTKIGLRFKMVIVLLLIAAIAMTSIAALGIFWVKSGGDMVIEDSTELLTVETKTHIERVISDKTYEIDRIFGSVESLMVSAEQFTIDVYKNPDNHQYVEQYFDSTYSNESDAPPDLQYSERYRRNVSFDTLVIKPAPGVNATSNESKETIRTFSKMVAFFKIACTEHTLIKWIYIATPNGLHFCYPGHGPYNVSYDPRLRPWYQRAMEAGTFGWSEPYVDAGGLGLMTTASIPVYDDTDKLIGVLGTDVTIETINEDIIHLKVGETSYSYLIDETGNVIARPRYTAGDIQWDETFNAVNLLNTTNVELNAVTARMVAGRCGLEDITYEGGRKFIVFAPVESTNWSLAVVIPRHEVIGQILETEAKLNEQIEAMAMSMLFVALCIAVIVIMVCIAFADTLTRPIKALTDSIVKVSDGDLSVNLEVRTSDELGTLATSFNRMTKDLERSRNEIREYSEKLETMVKERTSELEASEATLAAKVRELEKFTKLAVGRELKMVELKKKIKELERQLRVSNR